MANGHGGARVPRNPAPVSGPGAASARTDGGPSQPIRSLPDGGYGDNKAFRELQQSAPLPNMPSAPAGGGGGGGNPLASIIGLDAPTQFGDEPVTNGAALGDGAGVDALGIPDPDSPAERKADVASLHPGMVRAMLQASARPDAAPSFKRLVRSVLANQ